MLEFTCSIAILATIAAFTIAIWKLAESNAKTLQTLREMVEDQGRKLLARDLGELARDEASRQPDEPSIPRDDYAEAQIEWARQMEREFEAQQRQQAGDLG